MMKKAIDFIGKHKHLLILLLLITVSAFCQLYQINRDFNGFFEYDAAQYHLFSENIMKYGLSAKLGPVSNINPLNGKFTYYLYHPFLSVHIFALFFKIFGSTILIGRLIAMFFFALSAVCMYWLVATLWSKSVALWACFFYLFFPVSQYFGKFVGPAFILHIFAFAFLLFYYLWLRDGKPAYFYLLAASYALGCATDWEAFVLGPIAFLHYRCLLKKKGREVFSLLFIGAFLIAAYLAVNYFLTGSFLASQRQWPASIPDIKGMVGENLDLIHHVLIRMDFTLLLQGSYYFTILGHLLNSFTLPALLLVSYFLFNYQTFKYFSGPTIYAFFLAFLYLFYGLINPETLPGHITLTAYLSASFAIICALVASKASRLFQASFIVLFLVFSFFGTQKFYALNDTWQAHLMLGKVISAVSEPKDGIALTEPFFSPYIEYRGQRKILYDAYTWERMFYAINSGKIKYFITAYEDYRVFLIDKYPAIFLPETAQCPDYHLVLFDVQKKGIAPSRRSLDISFANNMKLIDFSCKRLPYGYLLLEYGWEKTGNINDKFMVFVHFEDSKGEILFGQDHYILNGIRDMTRAENKPIMESYIIKIPDNALNKGLSVYIGLYSPETNLRVSAINAPSKDNRVYLGRI